MILYVIVCVTLCTAKWRLAMNLNPSDGNKMHFCTAWHRNVNRGSSTNALKNDFFDKKVRLSTANSIAIVRHNSSYPDAVKIWRFKTPNVSLLSKFYSVDGSAVTEGGDIYRKILSPDPEDDPIFTVDGDIVLNYRYLDNGIRLMLSDSIKNNASDNTLGGFGVHNNLCDSCNKISRCRRLGYEALVTKQKRLNTNKNYAFFVSHNLLDSFPMNISLRIVEGISGYIMLLLIFF